MKLVIDISKDDYQNILSMAENGRVFNLLEAVAEGVPLKDIIRDIVPELEKEEYPEDAGGYVIPAYKVYEILDKHVEESK